MILKNFLFYLLLLINLGCFGQSNSIRFNEVVTSNTTGISDRNGDRWDWVELYNPTDRTIKLKGYAISDDKEEIEKFVLPNCRIKANGFLVIYCSKSKGRKELHANFKLKASGEWLWLSNQDGEIIDSVPALWNEKNYAISRKESGYPVWERNQVPTPNRTNANNNLVSFSHASGIYENPFKLEISANKDVVIRFTLDGSTPNKESSIYSNELDMTSRKKEEDIISFIQTGQIKPDKRSDPFKANTVRVGLFKDDKLVSKIYTQIYFVSKEIKNRYNGIEVVSITTDSDNLFNLDSGIYVKGNRGFRNGVNGNFNRRGKEWERESHFSIINGNGVEILNEDVGIRIHGATSRKMRQKSIRIYARKEYGTAKINYDGFEHTSTKLFDRLVLRNTMSGWQKTVFKEELTNYVCRDLRFDWLDYKVCVVYINGEYWGIHHIRERFDKFYVANKYNLNQDSINIVLHGDYKDYYGGDKGLYVEGESASMAKLYDFLRENDIAKSTNYEKVKKALNLEALIDFYCAEFYFGNTDYLENNNKLWRFGENGKWNQVFYDLDGAWSLKENNISKIMSGKKQSRAGIYTTNLFRKLMSSEVFKTQFFNRLACLLKTDFSEQVVSESIEHFEAIYEPIIKEHTIRWSYPGSVRQWQGKLNTLKAFAKNRGEVVKFQVQEVFGVNLEKYECL